MLIDAVQQRVRADFRIAIYLVFAAIAVAVLLPIATVRFTQGRYLLVAIEAVIIAGILLAAWHAWRGTNLNRVGIAMAIALTIGGCAIAALSPLGLYWLFPILMATAFLAPFWFSIPAFAITMAFLWWHGESLAQSGQPLAVLAAMGVNSMFAAVFARHTGDRRAHLEQLANRDALTGVGNRRALERALAGLIAEKRENAKGAALVMLDLDHFKRVNDQHGHDAGDKVLRQFAALVQLCTRSSDRLFRFGGEEFVLLLEQADARAIERVFALLQQRLLQDLRVGDSPVTTSAGAALLQGGEAAESWLARADAALYRAKQEGRNRLVLAD